MKTQTLIRLLPCTLLLAGGLSFTACSDDDDTPSIPNTELTDTESATAQELSRVLSMLAEDGELSSGWATRTVEPTEGVVLDESKPFVRSMAVNDLDEARSYFEALSGESLAAGSTSATWQCAGLGSLTYTEVKRPDCLATIEVNLKQMPKLQVLNLVPPTAIGDNVGGFDEYYHFGDVIEDTRNNTRWICGRPSSSANKKTKSYWFSFDLDETSHVKAITDYKYKSYLPHKIGSNADKVKDFGILLRMMRNLDEVWAAYSLYNPGKKFSEVVDMDEEGFDRMYGLATFGWRTTLRNGVQQEAVRQLLDQEDGDFLKNFVLFYDGGSSSGKGVLKAYFYEEKALSTALKVKFNVNFNQGCFDIRDYTKTGMVNERNSFFSLEYQADKFPTYGLPVRVKTGYELSTKLVGNPDPSKPLPGVSTGVLKEYLLSRNL